MARSHPPEDADPNRIGAWTLLWDPAFAWIADLWSTTWNGLSSRFPSAELYRNPQIAPPAGSPKRDQPAPPDRIRVLRLRTSGGETLPTEILEEVEVSEYADGQLEQLLRRLRVGFRRALESCPETTVVLRMEAIRVVRNTAVHEYGPRASFDIRFTRAITATEEREDLTDRRLARRALADLLDGYGTDDMHEPLTLPDMDSLADAVDDLDGAGDGDGGGAVGDGDADEGNDGAAGADLDDSDQNDDDQDGGAGSSNLNHNATRGGSSMKKELVVQSHRRPESGSATLRVIKTVLAVQERSTRENNRRLDSVIRLLVATQRAAQEEMAESNARLSGTVEGLTRNLSDARVRIADAESRASVAARQAEAQVAREQANVHAQSLAQQRTEAADLRAELAALRAANAELSAKLSKPPKVTKEDPPSAGDRILNKVESIVDVGIVKLSSEMEGGDPKPSGGSSGGAGGAAGPASGLTGILKTMAPEQVASMLGNVSADQLAQIFRAIGKSRPLDVEAFSNAVVDGAEEGVADAEKKGAS